MPSEASEQVPKLLQLFRAEQDSAQVNPPHPETQVHVPAPCLVPCPLQVPVKINFDVKQKSRLIIVEQSGKSVKYICWVKKRLVWVF